MDNNNMKYINTDNLTIINYGDGSAKLQIYNKYKSPYGWSPRELITSLFGKPLKERIMFGTDWPYFTYAMEDKVWVEWIKNIPETAKKYNLNFTDEEIKKILGLNAKKILKL